MPMIGNYPYQLMDYRIEQWWKDKTLANFKLMVRSMFLHR